MLLCIEPAISQAYIIRKTAVERQGNKWRDGGTILQSKTLTQNFFYLKELCGQNGEEPEEKEVQWQAQIGIPLKGRSKGPDTITDAMVCL